MKGRIIVSTLLALLLLVSMPVSALAATWDIGKGDITVNADTGMLTRSSSARSVDTIFFPFMCKSLLLCSD